MRVLLLFRGSPGCGKSTFIREKNLEQYTLSADDIRMKIASPALNIDGSLTISQKDNKAAWRMLFEFLEKRMKKGEFTVIDATNSKTSEISRYKEYAKKYRYRMYIVDMTDIPIEVAKERNANRMPEYKRVPDEAIDKMYARFATQKVPSGVKAIKPDELDAILYKPMDLNGYRKIHMIGDLHACYSVLKEYLVLQYFNDKGYDYIHVDNENIYAKKDEDRLEMYELKDYNDLATLLNPRDAYVFVGDYLDRGIETIELMKALLSIYRLPNVIMLEGNHEMLPLRNYANNVDDYPRYFREDTLPVLNKIIAEKEIEKKDLKDFCDRLSQICYYKYKRKKVFVCHGGVSGLKDNPIFISTEQLVRGVGEYGDYLECTKAFEENTDENVYQVSGHRNVSELPVQASERCFNLEGKVEYGGCLRVVTLDENGFETHEIKNNIFKEKEVVKVALPKEVEGDVVTQLRNSPYVKERVMGNISSFNFTRDAFYNKVWNEQTTKARGLFIDTRDGSVSARGYNKFFNIKERPETKLDSLQHNLKFPVTAYVKENGFLGLISYNKDTDDLLFATKSVVDYAAQENDLVNVFKELYTEITTEQQRQLALDFVRTCNATLICECVHQQKDPHIIEYSSNRIYLLDIIDNDLYAEKVDYEYLLMAASLYGLTCKEKVGVFNNWEEFYTFYLEATDENYKYHNRYIEGFVIEDAEGFMVKIKLAYYNFWKFMRSITQSVLKRGYIEKTGSLYNAEANYYYGWLKDHRDEYISKDENGKVAFDKVNIIELRKRFLNYMENKNDSNRIRY